MTFSNFSKRTARYFMARKAAKEIKKEIEKAGLDTLEKLVNGGTSIVGTYLYACSPREKATYRRSLSILLQSGITIDMILYEITVLMPELAHIIEKNSAYKKTEIQKIKQFLGEG